MDENTVNTRIMLITDEVMQKLMTGNRMLYVANPGKISAGKEVFIEYVRPWKVFIKDGTIMKAGKPHTWLYYEDPDEIGFRKHLEYLIKHGKLEWFKE